MRIKNKIIFKKIKMGTKNSKPKKLFEIKKSSSIKEEKITKSSFDFINIIGKGGFGKVWKVYSRKYKKVFAMKQMSLFHT